MENSQETVLEQAHLIIALINEEYGDDGYGEEGSISVVSNFDGHVGLSLGDGNVDVFKKCCADIQSNFVYEPDEEPGPEYKALALIADYPRVETLGRGNHVILLD